ncbi:hypothetical protein CANARDRAFT_7178 [[Candida] arabinofermentans NRRL YB-2248]|uniref:Uncharacterized protein n=1 Tax=[Candida] arabinofermentans NRRL YB-2248 TaxID=983967 RepID=A0A1E4T216_9ASCO|nr:hypothetical protein CANARDRAFT_7178 [[Candida] arabinofermentans NRRL YB-2248]
MTGSKSTIKRSATDSNSDSLKKRKTDSSFPSPTFTSTQSHDTLFEISNEGYVSTPMLSEDDDEGDNDGLKQPISKTDLRYNFSNIVNQNSFSSHPSATSIDLHSEMKLQRQRRLVQLELLRYKELEDSLNSSAWIMDDEINNSLNANNNADLLSDDSSDDDNESKFNSNLFDDYLNLSSSEDEELSEDSLPKFNYIKTIKINDQINNDNDSSCIGNLNSMTTGLEQVDRIIKQLNHSNTEDEFLKLNDQIILNDSSEKSILNESNFNNLIEKQKVTLSKPSDSNNDDKNCNLISQTSFFHLLGYNKKNSSKSKSNDKTMTSNNDDLKQKSEMSLDEFLNLEEQQESSVIINNNNNNNNVNQSTADDALSHFKKLEYRYNNGKINLALVDHTSNVDSNNLKSKKKRQSPLNKRALFYGNHSEMVNNDSSICLNDFII